MHDWCPVLDHGRITSGEDGAWLSDGPMAAIGGTNGLCLQSAPDGWPFGGILVVPVTLMLASVQCFAPRIRCMFGRVVMSTSGLRACMTVEA